MDKIKLIVADDHSLFRRSFVMLLSQIPDFELLGEASNGAELLDLMSSSRPDLALLDLQMPIMDGFETAERIQSMYPHIKIIIISMHDEEKLILQLLEKGVNGYLLKDTEPDEVEVAIRRVMEEGFYYSDFVSKIIHRKMITQQQSKTKLYNSKIQISNREMETLVLLCEGLSNQEIGTKMFVSTRTVEGHRLRLLEKTGTKNTAGLVAFAFKNNLI